jgi:hypothetical protein
MSVSNPGSRSSHLLLPLEALVFWSRNQLAFWIAAFPIAVLAAALAHFLPADDWANAPVFTIAYALFLDRWQKIALLEGAPICEEADELRRMMITTRFLLLAIGAYALALLAMPLPMIGVVLWCLVLTPLLLLLPALSAGDNLGLGNAWRLGRPVHLVLFALILATALLSIFAQDGADWIVAQLPRKTWAPLLAAGLARLVDCLLLAIAGHMLVSLYRSLSGWQPPEPEDRPYRVARRRNS